MTDLLARLDELLLSEATDRLSDAEHVELQALLAEHQDVDRYTYERAASTFFLAVCAAPAERMPESLSTRLSSDAVRRLARDDD